MLGADWQHYMATLKFEKYVLSPVLRKSHLKGHWHPLFYHLRKAISENWESTWSPMRRELCYLHRLRQQPLRLHDLARISIRRSVGGNQFKALLMKLPLPPKMKAFVRADITPQLLRMVFLFDCYRSCFE